MVITYHGVQSLRLQFGEMVIAFNPVGKASGFPVTRFRADIALVSLFDPAFSGIEHLSYGDRLPFVIDGPGEYEVNDIFVRGIPSRSRFGGVERRNTVYLLSLEGIELCFLGALSGPELPVGAKEVMDEVDVLFVPIGSGGVLSASEAYELAVAVEPRFIIPMHYGAVGEKNSLPTFLKEAGKEKLPPVGKLTLKKKDLEGKEGEIVVLSPVVSS